MVLQSWAMSMMNVHYIGPRNYPVVEHKGLVYKMEHRVYLSDETPPPFEGVDESGRRVSADTRPFWLFGFARMQIDCVYQGPTPLSENILRAIMPRLIDLVRTELNTGEPQHATLDKE